MMSEGTTIPSPLLLEQFRVHVWPGRAEAPQPPPGSRTSLFEERRKVDCFPLTIASGRPFNNSNISSNKENCNVAR